MFLSQPSALATLWLHTLHYLRGALGLLLVFKLPNTHDLIGKVEFPQTSAELLNEGGVGASVISQTTDFFHVYAQ